MPVYEFECEDCGRKFDIVATLTEKEAGLKPACPKCGCKKTRQVLGRFTLLTSSKSDVDDFDSEDFGDAAAGPDTGLGDDEGLDELGGAGSDDMDDLD